VGYLLARCFLNCLTVLARREASKDAELPCAPTRERGAAPPGQPGAEPSHRPAVARGPVEADPPAPVLLGAWSGQAVNSSTPRPSAARRSLDVQVPQRFVPVGVPRPSPVGREARHGQFVKMEKRLLDGNGPACAGPCVRVTRPTTRSAGNVDLRLSASMPLSLTRASGCEQVRVRRMMGENRSQHGERECVAWPTRDSTGPVN
jgi:hypothetical protein